jgi:hypothetical protein
MRGVTINGVHKGTPGAPDPLGQPTAGTPVPYTIPHCLLAPSGASSSGSTESAEPFGQYVVSRVQVIVLKSIPDVRPDDILTFWGHDWTIDGLVGPWEKGRLFGSVFMVERAS